MAEDTTEHLLCPGCGKPIQVRYDEGLEILSLSHPIPACSELDALGHDDPTEYLARARTNNEA